MNKMVITGVGPDQPGIVAGMCRVLYEAGCNVHDSSMTILEHEFAMITVVDVPSHTSEEKLKQGFAQVEKDLGMCIMIKTIQDGPFYTSPMEQPLPYMISVSGEDRTGITYKVSELLAAEKINITDLNAQIIPGETGPIYIMLIEVELPSNQAIQNLQAKLEQLQKTLQVEIHLRPIEPVTFN